MKLGLEKKIEPQPVGQVEFLTGLDDRSAPPPVEDALTFGRRDGRAMTVRHWTSACLILAVGFALGRLPADILASSGAHQSVAPAIVSSGIAPSAVSRSEWNDWSRPALDGGYSCLRETGGAGGQCNVAMHIDTPAQEHARHANAPDVLGINATGQIGNYDRRGHWYPYRGYVTATEAEHLIRIDRPKTNSATLRR